MEQTLHTRPDLPPVAPAGECVEQLPLARVLLLHLTPGMGIVLILWLITPWLINRGLPTELGFLLGVVVFSLPLELGYLLYLGKKRNGVFSLRGIVLYTRRMPLWQYAALFLPFLIYGLGLQALYSPVETSLAKHLFGWMPVYMLLPSPLRSLTAITLTTALLTLALDGIISPIVEELYFRATSCHVSRTGDGLRRSLTHSCSLCNISGNLTIICSFFS